MGVPRVDVSSLSLPDVSPSKAIVEPVLQTPSVSPSWIGLRHTQHYSQHTIV